MDQSVENRIRERAYEMWTAHGCVNGQAEQHWLAAEREVLAPSTAVLAGKPDPKKNPRSSVLGDAISLESDHWHRRLLRVSAAGN